MNTIEQLIILLTFFLLLLIGGMLFTKQFCFLPKDCAGFCGGDTPECNGVCGAECKEDSSEWEVIQPIELTGWAKSEPIKVDNIDFILTYSNPSIDCVLFYDERGYATVLNSVHCMITKEGYKNEIDFEWNLILTDVTSCDEETIRDWLDNNNIYDSLPLKLKEKIVDTI